MGYIRLHPPPLCHLSAHLHLVSKDFLVRFRLPRGISETNSRFFQIFLATEELFFGNLARILGRVRGFGLPVHPGGGSVSRSLSSLLGCGGASVPPSVAVCPWACPVPRWGLPAACSITANGKKSASVGLELGFVRPSLWPFPWGFYYIACLRTLSSGEQRAKIFIPFTRPFACSICGKFSAEQDTKKRNGLLFGRFLWLWLCGVSPF